MCVFAPHNIFRDPPFSRVDFISCCNLLIYLDPFLQKKALATFFYSLNENGYMMLGRSETVGSSRQFIQVNKKFKIYSCKKEAGSGNTIRGDVFLYPPAKKEKLTPVKTEKKLLTVYDLDKAIDSLLLSRYVYPCVVINQQMEILQFRGSVALYLQPSQGKASLNIQKMVHPELAFELRNAVSRSIKSKNTVKKDAIEMKRNGQHYFISIEVIPLKIEWDEPLLLVLFTGLV